MFIELSWLGSLAHTVLAVWSLILPLAYTTHMTQEPVQMSSWGDRPWYELRSALLPDRPLAGSSQNPWLPGILFHGWEIFHRL